MAVNDVNPTQLISRVAVELKKEALVKPTAWSPFAKTGMSKERAPVQQDWWFVRAASILRKVMILGPVGTSKLQRKYGARKNEGMAPEHFYVGAGNNIRKILQQLEKSGLIKQAQKGVHKGRIITPKGVSLLDRVASDLMKEQGVVLPATPAASTVSESKTDEQASGEAKKPKAPRKPRAPKKKEETPTAA